MATFPRLKLFGTRSGRVRAYSRVNPLDPILVNQHEITKEHQATRFRYIVRVGTTDAITEEPVERYVSISTDLRLNSGDILNMARDLVMDSPTSAAERAEDASIEFALRTRR